MTVLIEFHGGPLNGKVAEFETKPRKYSVVANETLYRYWIDDAIKPGTEGDADEVLRGVEVRQP